MSGMKVLVPQPKVNVVTGALLAVVEEYKKLENKPTDLHEANILFDRMVMASPAASAAYLEVIVTGIANTGEPYWLWRRQS